MTQNPLLPTAMALHQAGAFADAEKAYRLALQMEPQNADALALLGCVLSEQKKHDEALGKIDAALALDATTPLFHFHRGNALNKATRYAEAETAFAQAAMLAPSWAEAWYNRGNAAREAGQHDAAKSHYEKTLALNPAHTLAANNLALLYAKEENFAKARALLDEALKRAPKNTTLLHSLNGVAFGQNDLPTAFESARVLAEIKLGLEGRSILDVLKDVSTLDLSDDQTCNAIFALGVSTLLQGDLKLASYILRSFLTLEPSSSEALSMLGSIHLARSAMAGADECNGAAFMMEPSNTAAPWNRAMAILTRGDLRGGFRRYRWRWQALDKFKRMRLHAPMWDGLSDIKGKTILVHEEQGFGDSLQMLRYMPLLKARGARVYFYARPVLHPLIKNWNGLDAALEWDVLNKTVPAGVDLVCGAMDMPGLMGTTLGNIPSFPAYLPNPYAGQERYKLQGSKPKIGLVWMGNPLHKRDHERSIPLSLWEPLLQNRDVQFYSFQFKSRAEDTPLMERYGIIDLAPQIKNLADTAAFLHEIDLLITVDSAPAHLAGGLGKKVWTLVTLSPDWRWLLGRDDSPWYPSLRLFRQTKTGDWKSVISEVSWELSCLSGPLSSSAPSAPLFI